MELFNTTALPAPTRPSYREDRIPGFGNDSRLSDFWVGVILALSLISCVGFLCTLYLYHMVQKWKAAAASVRPLQVVEVHRTADADASDVEENLPDYMQSSGGLPTYQQALDQLRREGGGRRPSSAAMLHYSSSYAGRGHPTRLSVKELLKSYKRSASSVTLGNHHAPAVT